MPRGRRRDTSIYHDILSRLVRGESEWELRSGDGPCTTASGKALYTRGQLQHYVKQLTTLGYIRTDTHLTDAVFGKKWLVTEKGVRWLNRAARELTPKRGRILRGGENRDVSTQKVLPTEPTLLPPKKVLYTGVHNIVYRMDIVTPGTLSNKFVWDGEKEMRNWSAKYARIGSMYVQLNGTKSVTVDVAAKDSDPYAASFHALTTVLRMKQAVEDQYGCHLKEPVLVSRQKHEYVGDPVADYFTKKGVTLHTGGAGFDNTPSPGTLHLESDEEAMAYLQMPRTLLEIHATLEEQGRQLRALGEGVAGTLAEQMKALQALGKAQEMTVKLLTDMAARMGFQVGETTEVSNGKPKKTKRRSKDTREGYA